jgi:hypothetical protein
MPYLARIAILAFILGKHGMYNAEAIEYRQQDPHSFPPQQISCDDKLPVQISQTVRHKHTLPTDWQPPVWRPGDIYFNKH